MKCKKCLVDYPSSNEYFYNRTDGHFGFYQPCKKCRSIRVKGLTDEQKEIRRIKNKLEKIKFRILNPEKAKEQNRKYYLNKISKKYNGQLTLYFKCNNLSKYNSNRKTSWNKGLSMPEETRRKISEKMKGANSYLWNGGISSESAKIRNSIEYREWRRAIFKRDNFTCQICGQVGGKLNADHIKPFATHHELRFELSNGRTLCVPCHKNTDTFGIKFYHSLIKNKNKLNV